ncbi:uncharacterized protein LOC127264133 isoform X2 [Andrographis paniculata]|uniref:uncharacterized protein LOC127264133 isoform X2 n=1 Tax=Andrographis paniculata TaxID=175694 RepID=UPI0021E72F52|nr:uncharacterized protein LOC127264133 isoform X2 [Andrographis paniculata]
MAETKDPSENNDCTFQWDESSQLYYHASTGFYHDPQAGWYYSSRDGLYYKFEDGEYTLLDGYQASDQTEMNDTNGQGETLKAQMQGREISETDSSAFEGSDQTEYPPPPSEWLEDTLIEMYLSGYPNQTTYAADANMATPVETNEVNIEDPCDEDNEELEEGEWIPDDPDFWKNISERSMDEGISPEEENWCAQFSQPSQLYDEWMLDLQIVDLWDWALVRGTKKDGKTEVSRLVGRLRKPSRKLHPSVPSGGVILKTAPICETHLDLVRVSSGKIYRLRNPSLQYVASLPVYDASNPTKDWGFPTVKNHTKKSPKSHQQLESQSIGTLDVLKDKSLSLPAKKDHTYRDRAAERRALHKGFGIGPGQKKPLTDDDSPPSSPPTHPEEAAAESMDLSFGSGSYARKIMEGMGWKEGEVLGSSMKGLSKPLQATGNKGTAGLGWNNNRKRF